MGNRLDRVEPQSFLAKIGIVDAALASLLGYTSVSLVLVGQAIQGGGISSWTAFCPTGEDLRAVWCRLVGVIGGLAR